MKTSRNVVRVVVAVVVVVATGVAAAVVLRPRAVDVDVAVVDRGEVVDELVEDGRARWRDRAVIAAPSAGMLAAHGWRVGDRVDAGGVVARLSPLRAPLVGGAERAGLVAAEDAAAAALAQATATLERARAAASAATLDEQRALALVAAGGAPRAQGDDARARAHAAAHDVDGAVFAVQVARAQLAVAQAAHARSDEASPQAAGTRGGRRGDRLGERRGDDVPPIELRSPLSGVVLAVFVDDAGPVAVGTPLLEVGDPRAVEVVVPLLSDDAARLPAVVSARVTAWGGPDLMGHVGRVEPRATPRLSALGIEEDRANVIVDVDELPPAPPGDGYRARVAFALWRGEVVRVSTAALVRGAGGWGVWQVVDGRAAWTPVTPGHRGGDTIEVIDGLRVGDVVIEHPGEQIVERARVRPR